MTVLKVTSVGNATGVILRGELLVKLGVTKGDKLYVVETPVGIERTAWNPEVGQQLELAESVMRQDHDVLKRLGE